MTARRVFFYVQHLLGIGHYKRAVTLVNAMTRSGMEVTMVSGGHPLPALPVHAARLVQLPAAGTADLTFRTLLDAQGQPVDDAWKARRAARLLEAFEQADPHAVVIELFPFGRRQMRFELLPLLEAVRLRSPVPVRVSSVRDVLGGGQKDPARQDQMLQAFDRHFDQLLVHGDASVVPFDATFRHTAALGQRMHYTGYVVELRVSGAGADGAGRDEVLVSAGGGAVGQQLLRTASLARPLTQQRHTRWRMLAGMNASEFELGTLRQLASQAEPGGITVERHRADFVDLLGNCRLSISQAGYNTTMEVLNCGARAVLVPFSGGAEIEQSLRARLLAQRGWIELLEEAQLTPHNLALAVDRAAVRPVGQVGAIDLDGARRSAELLAGWIEERYR